MPNRQRNLLARAVSARLDLHGLVAADLKGLDRKCLARLPLIDRDAAHSPLATLVSLLDKLTTTLLGALAVRVTVQLHRFLP
jgi:hypothetical protein